MRSKINEITDPDSGKVGAGEKLVRGIQGNKLRWYNVEHGDIELICLVNTSLSRFKNHSNCRILIFVERKYQ